MADRLPFYNIDSSEVLKEIIKEGVIVTESQYRSKIKQSCVLKNCSIEVCGEEDDEFHTNIILGLTYTKNVSKDSKIAPTDKTVKLRVLCGLGDREWGYRSKIKVWDGDYPSTVGVDIDSGTVYLLYVRKERLDLVEFGELEKQELDAFEDSLNTREPYNIGLDTNTLFAYLDGLEGYNFLKDNVYIDFNCCKPIRVYSKYRK